MKALKPKLSPRKARARLESRASDATRLLKLLANEQRLKVLCRLSGGELSVGELAEHVDLAQSALSQHLAKLRADRLVATRRDGQTIYYRLADPTTEKLIGVLCDIYGGHD
ncbi:MAG: winged helix-turn-helix transcriptional regulator [Proteobacteria bacterium]|nr:winged helix-turn-helix transcriptional regulator [Pseudomonadota bacterium]